MERKNHIIYNLRFIGIFFCLQSCIQLIHHNQFKAISSANKLLTLLFNKRYKDAYLKLHLNTKERLPFEVFQEMSDQVFF